MRDEKEERKKQARSNKQHSTHVLTVSTSNNHVQCTLYMCITSCMGSATTNMYIYIYMYMFK